jgi:hypothetical protein
MGHVNQQRELRAELRSESCLVPLGLPLVAKPKAGPTVAAYFRAKHARGGPFSFAPEWGLARCR